MCHPDTLILSHFSVKNTRLKAFLLNPKERKVLLIFNPSSKAVSEDGRTVSALLFRYLSNKVESVGTGKQKGRAPAPSFRPKQPSNCPIQTAFDHPQSVPTGFTLLTAFATSSRNQRKPQFVVINGTTETFNYRQVHGVGKDRWFIPVSSPCMGQDEVSPRRPGGFIELVFFRDLKGQPASRWRG